MQVTLKNPEYHPDIHDYCNNQFPLKVYLQMSQFLKTKEK